MYNQYKTYNDYKSYNNVCFDSFAPGYALGLTVVPAVTLDTPGYALDLIRLIISNKYNL